MRYPGVSKHERQTFEEFSQGASLISDAAMVGHAAVRVRLHMHSRHRRTVLWVGVSRLEDTNLSSRSIWLKNWSACAQVPVKLWIE